MSPPESQNPFLTLYYNVSVLFSLQISQASVMKVLWSPDEFSLLLILEDARNAECRVR